MLKKPWPPQSDTWALAQLCPQHWLCDPRTDSSLSGPQPLAIKETAHCVCRVGWWGSPTTAHRAPGMTPSWRTLCLPLSAHAEGTLTLQEEGRAQYQSGAPRRGNPSPGLHGQVTVSAEQTQAGPNGSITPRSPRGQWCPEGWDGAGALSLGHAAGG